MHSNHARYAFFIGVAGTVPVRRRLPAPAARYADGKKNGINASPLTASLTAERIIGSRASGDDTPGSVKQRERHGAWGGRAPQKKKGRCWTRTSARCAVRPSSVLTRTFAFSRLCAVRTRSTVPASLRHAPSRLRTRREHSNLATRRIGLKLGDPFARSSPMAACERRTGRDRASSVARRLIPLSLQPTSRADTLFGGHNGGGASQSGTAAISAPVLLRQAALDQHAVYESNSRATEQSLRTAAAGLRLVVSAQTDDTRSADVTSTRFTEVQANLTLRRRTINRSSDQWLAPAVR